MNLVNRLLSLAGLKLSRINKQRQMTGNEYPKYSYRWLNNYLFPFLLDEGGKAFRPNYLWGVIQGVNLAKSLGINKVSVLEFGVAGGNGLISLERIADKVSALYGIEIDVFGFDTGFGLPEPKDYRDEPHIHVGGDYKMDVERLKKELKKAKLVLGLLDETIGHFIESAPLPVAFVSIDVDMYSSTMHALHLLDAEESLLMPRIYFYFDDIMGPTKNEFAGERLAISDFNKFHEKRKIIPVRGLKYHLPEPLSRQVWVDKTFMAHIFDHSLYGRFDGLSELQIDLSLKQKSAS